jgi:hypothetical protein
MLAVQVCSIRAALPQHARRRPQYVQPSTPSHIPVDAADLQSRSGSAVVRRRCSGVRPDQPLPPFKPPLVAVTKPATLHRPSSYSGRTLLKSGGVSGLTSHPDDAKALHDAGYSSRVSQYTMDCLPLSYSGQYRRRLRDVLAELAHVGTNNSVWCLYNVLRSLV